MSLQQFEYVLAVARYRHFTTAAEKCFVSQSTLSTMIRKFEEELGVVIFNRRKNPVEITREGKQIIERLKIIDKEVAGLGELIKEMKGELKGVLKIACIPTVAPYLLPLFLPDFSKKYPELILEVKESTTGEIIRKLKSRELDIGIVSTPINEPELTEYPLFREAFVLYDTSQIPESGKVRIDAVDLTNLWLLEEGHCLRDQVLEICNSKPEQTSGNIRFKAGSIDSLVKFVKSNKGKTLLPYLASENLSEPDSRYLSYFENPVPARSVGLLVHRHFIKKKPLDLLTRKIVKKINELESKPNLQLTGKSGKTR